MKGVYNSRFIVQLLKLNDILGPWLFYVGANLEEIEIPGSIEDIGDWCFNKCSSLRHVAIPESIDIKPNTFNNCGAEVIRK